MCFTSNTDITQLSIEEISLVQNKTLNYAHEVTWTGLLFGCRATAGIECMLGSAMYLKSTGISLEKRKDKCYKYIKNATYKRKIQLIKATASFICNKIHIYTAKAILQDVKKMSVIQLVFYRKKNFVVSSLAVDPLRRKILDLPLS